MVDASVGGKTGVDLPQGKNLVGAFKQPAFVGIDPAVLSTLPAAEFRSGLAEVVKHGMIGAPALFEALEGKDEMAPLALAELIADAVRVKVAVVEEDPFERGRRAVLNLGHTFGHAVEVVSGYRIRHGEGVAIGLVAATRLAARRGLCDPELVVRVARLLERLELPTAAPGLAPEQIVAAMATDKKRAGGRLRFVLPRNLGDVDVFDDVAIENVLAVLTE
jgi:3-dehydroquinate synthetase